MKMVNQLPYSVLTQIEGVEELIKRLMIEQNMLSVTASAQRARTLEPLLAYLAYTLTSMGEATLANFYVDCCVGEYNHHVNAWNDALRQATLYLWDHEPIRQTVFGQWKVLHGKEGERQHRSAMTAKESELYGITMVGALYKLQGTIFDLVDDRKLHSPTLEQLRSYRHPGAQKIPMMI